MRHLLKNKQTVYWADFQRSEPVIDLDGNDTGEQKLFYTEPRKTAWNVGCVDSDAEVEMFGARAIETIKIVTDGRPDITETSIIWFGKKPDEPYKSDSPRHNYAVVGIQKSLNETVVFARKVNFS